MNRPKTPKGNKIKPKFICIKEKEVTLLDIAEDLEKLVSNLNIKSDINSVIIKLKYILLDIYKIINDSKKISTKIENGIKGNKKLDENIKKEV